MTDYLAKSGLSVHPLLVDFVEKEALAGLSVTAEQFWSGFATLVAEHAPANARLLERQKWLTAKNFAALKYSGPGTDLTLGLADGHAWKGGSSHSRNGIVCNPNIPT